MVIVFEFLAAPQTVSGRGILYNYYVYSVCFYPLKSSHFLSQLEEFGSERGVGLGALKNLIKTVLIISFH